MKNTAIFIVLFYLFVFVGCAGKDGAMGPMGVNGVNGAPGSGSTIYITANTTWSSDKYLTSNVYIDKNCTLTINPGVTVFLYPNCNFTGDGKIIAIGTSGQKIRFTKAINSIGGSIITYTSTNIFQYCIFDNLLSIDSAKAIIINSVIKNNSGFLGFYFAKLISCDIFSNSRYIERYNTGLSFMSNNYIAYNNGSTLICSSTNWPNDLNSPNQYMNLTSANKAPRITPNNP